MAESYNRLFSKFKECERSYFKIHNRENTRKAAGIIATVFLAGTFNYIASDDIYLDVEIKLASYTLVYIFLFAQFKFEKLSCFASVLMSLSMFSSELIRGSSILSSIFYPIAFLSIIFGIERVKGRSSGIEENEDTALYIRMLNSFMDRVAVIDTDGRVVYLNKSWEVVNRSHSNIIPFKIAKGVSIIELLDNIKEKIAREASEKFKQIFNGKLDQFDFEYCIDTLGEKRWYKVIAGAIPDEKGRVFLTHLDITKRKTAEIQLTESKKRYRRLIESIPDAIVLHVNGEVVFANNAAVNLFRIKDKSEIKGRNIFDFVHEDYREIINKRVVKVQRDFERVPLIEEKMIRADGTEVEVEVASIFYLYDEKPASLVVIRDITERRQTEELRRCFEEKNELLNKAYEYDKVKSEFFTNISHELRTPLNVILSATQILSLPADSQGTYKAEKTDKYIYMIKQNCYRLLRLVNNLIDISKIDSGFYEIHLQNIDIISIVENITLSVVEYAKEKSIYIEFDTDVEEKYMACDPDKIERIMLNILSNSIKFTEPGGKICVNMFDMGNYVRIITKDNGMGIPEDKLGIIFERFRQVNKSLIKNNQGSGIGLSLVKSLVELHGGSIDVSSKIGSGTEFIVDLPVKLVEEKINEDNKNLNNDLEQSKIERISVEFSDIYSSSHK